MTPSFCLVIPDSPPVRITFLRAFPEWSWPLSSPGSGKIWCAPLAGSLPLTASCCGVFPPFPLPVSSPSSQPTTLRWNSESSSSDHTEHLAPCHLSNWHLGMKMGVNGKFHFDDEGTWGLLFHPEPEFPSLIDNKLASCFAFLAAPLWPLSESVSISAHFPGRWEEKVEEKILYFAALLITVRKKIRRRG